MNSKYIISVDLGGTKILSALVNDDRQIIDRVKVPTDVSGKTNVIVDAIAASVKKIISNNSIDIKDIGGISLGVPGTVDPYSGMIFNAPNLHVTNFNIKEALQAQIDLPIIIENDVNLAGLGIRYFEMKDSSKNMLIVFVGTGIGSALFFNGCIYRGSSFFAGEIGHMKVTKKGVFSNDSKAKTFEQIASRTAVVNSIIKDIEDGEESELAKYVKAKKRIKSSALKKAVKSGDKVVVKRLDKSAKVIGTVLGSLTTLLNVDTIVLGGGVIEAMDDYLVPKIKEAFDAAVLPEPGKIVNMFATKLGDDAPLYGGLALAHEFLDN